FLLYPIAAAPGGNQDSNSKTSRRSGREVPSRWLGDRDQGCSWKPAQNDQPLCRGVAIRFGGGRFARLERAGTPGPGEYGAYGTASLEMLGRDSEGAEEGDRDR